jgi:hypothetical protein
MNIHVQYIDYRNYILEKITKFSHASHQIHPAGQQLDHFILLDFNVPQSSFLFLHNVCILIERALSALNNVIPFVITQG